MHPSREKAKALDEQIFEAGLSFSISKQITGYLSKQGNKLKKQIKGVGGMEFLEH